MKCPICGVEMLLDHRNETGRAVHRCRNPQCERSKLADEKKEDT